MSALISIQYLCISDICATISSSNGQNTKTRAFKNPLRSIVIKKTYVQFVQMWLQITVLYIYVCWLKLKRKGCDGNKYTIGGVLINVNGGQTMKS